MKISKFLILVILGLLVVISVFTQKRSTLEEQIMSKPGKSSSKIAIGNTRDEKVNRQQDVAGLISLAEGSYSKMSEPFIFVARTKETYEQLKNMVKEFSSDKVINFNKQAVIAAFSGTKNTGGHSVSIGISKGKIFIEAVKPAKGAIVTQALTQPYKIVAVTIGKEKSLSFEASDNWNDRIVTYRITSGKFEITGGFIGIRKTIVPEGTVGVIKSADFVTFIFKIEAKGTQSGRKLDEICSGKMSKFDADILRFAGGDFIDRPHPPFKVYVDISENKLTMRFVPDKRDWVVSDGFEGRGNLEATKENKPSVFHRQQKQQK